jgi:hypothetical protein
MYVVAWDTLRRLGRIPRFDEGYGEKLTDVLRKGTQAEVWMVSHRWTYL